MIFALQVLFVWVCAVLALFSMMGCLGLGNLVLSASGHGTWRTHLALWVTCLVVALTCLSVMPRYIGDSPDGDRWVFCDTRPCPPVEGS
ncbi:hypothetical protein [Streptosporangium sp. NPDC002524]|uniref:hypothetical protein n=1 Tax=Streptosporangium sp. NPDC002524 TaxID=3154537 RepID=UPI0033233056